MTHQDILTRRDAILDARRAAIDKAIQDIDKPFDKEIESLMELCGGLGHVLTKDDFGNSRYCVVCNHEEKAKG